MTRERREAVYGGTFDPFCQHHLDVIKRLREQDGFDYVVVVPAFRNPFKNDGVDYAHRLNMLELGLTGFEDGVVVVEVERLLLQQVVAPIRTWQVMNFLSATLTNPTFVIGEDLVSQLDEWEQIEHLRETYGFHVVPDLGVHASDVRKEILHHDYGMGAWEKLVPRLVVQYIKRHNLYRYITQ